MIASGTDSSGCSEALAQLLAFHSVLLLGRSFANRTQSATLNKKPLCLSEAPVAFSLSY